MERGRDVGMRAGGRAIGHGVAGPSVFAATALVALVVMSGGAVATDFITDPRKMVFNPPEPRCWAGNAIAWHATAPRQAPGLAPTAGQ